MAKQRIVNTKFWDDSYITGLSPEEKLLFLYLITNPLTNISGIYELPVKRVAFDTGIEQGELERIVKKFEQDGKLIVSNGWVAVVNFIKHQSLNPKVKYGIAKEIIKAPREITDRLSIDYQSLCGNESERLSIGYSSLSHLNSNLNTNINPNSDNLPLGKLSTEERQEIKRRKGELVKRWQV